MNTLKRDLYRALYTNYQAKKDKALFQLNLAFENPVAIGEHPQHLEEINKLLNKIAEAKDKMEALEAFE